MSPFAYPAKRDGLRTASRPERSVDLDVARRELGVHAARMRRASATDAHVVARSFLRFFDLVGAHLFEQEEASILAVLGGRPPSDPVVDVLIDHIDITTLAAALSNELAAGCADHRLVIHLGERLERHLVRETELSLQTKEKL